MAPAEPRPLRICELRRPFSQEEALRRLVAQLELSPATRLLEVAGGLDGWAVPLARQVGCPVIVADPDDAVLDALRERVRASGVKKVELRRADLDRLPFGDGEFQAVIAHTGALLPASGAAQRLARLIDFDGRLALLAATRVGRFPNAQVLGVGESLLGEAPVLPRELLQTFAAAGFEPDRAESLSDLELDALYRAVEKDLGADPRSNQLRAEVVLHRSQGGRSSYSFSVLTGRRRKPGEKPAAPRSGA
jgi:SAM-dependent methyltransferase